MPRLKESSWVLEARQSQVGALLGGWVVTYGQPFWRANFSYSGLKEAEFRALSAWIARREGARYTFTAFRPSRRQPIEGPSVNNSGIGISSVDTSGSTISFSGLPCDLSAGDMVSYYTNQGGYYCGEVMYDAAEVSGAATVTVKPAPVTAHTSTPAVRIVEALCEFQIEGIPAIAEPFDKKYAVSFAARQVERG